MTLLDLSVRESAYITAVKGGCARRLADMGLTAGAEVHVERFALGGDPVAVRLGGYTVALRRSEAATISVSYTPPARRHVSKLLLARPRPAFPHTDRSGDVMLVGNPNSGKTSLFNALTGAHCHVGNFPGVTVDVKTAPLLRHPQTQLVDLPGMYSVASAAGEEAVAASFFRSHPPSAVIGVVDATCLMRGLALMLDVISAGIPAVVALTMTDELEKDGSALDTALLSRSLGVPVVPISVPLRRGISALEETVLRTLERGRAPGRPRMSPTKEAFLETLCHTAVKPSRTPSRMTQRLDAVLCGRYTALPVFALLMAAILFVTFHIIGGICEFWLDAGISLLSSGLGSMCQRAALPLWLTSLTVDGILAGVGNILGFLPVTVALFFFLSLLEDSGYLARVAFFLDPPFRAFGLSGRSAVPLLLGFGCTVPGVMACRTLKTREEQRGALRLLPFVSCSAKLPVAALFASLLLPRHAALFTALFYLLPLLFAVPVALVARRQSRAEEFLLELPRYRMPLPRNVVRLLGQRTKEFVKKAFTVIFLSSIAAWALSFFTPTFAPAASAEESLLAYLAGFFAPLFVPLGLGDFRCVAALLFGFFAKESIVSTLFVLYGGNVALSLAMPPDVALPFLVFALLYTPCAAALAAVSKEFGARRALSLAICQLCLAWLAAFAVRGVTLLFSLA